MTIPAGPVTVPTIVVDLAEGRDVTAVWVNELGGTTYALGDEEFVKVYPDVHAALLVRESSSRIARRAA